MSRIDGEDLRAFCATFTGKALTAGDADYDASRSLWNGAIDRSPAVIARCTTPEEVAEGIRFARAAGQEIAVRGGGHNYAGNAVCDGGMMIHLGDMNAVHVDPERRRATCGGGATWAELDAATQAHGLAVPGGFISHTGVGGLTLGGGMGWLVKKAGLSCDNLVSAQVVTADGRIVRADADENPDLFWALRGGGGNFGVVTSFEFALTPVGPMVNLGLFFFGLENGGEALRFSRDFIPTLGEDVTGFLAIGLSAPPAPFVPEQFHFRLGHALLVVGFGSPEEHAAAVAPVREAVTPLFEFVTPIPFVALQQMFNDSAPWGSLAYEKSLYLDGLSDEVIDLIASHVPGKSSPLAFVPTFTLSGRYHEVGEDDTAFGGSRQARFALNIESTTMDRDTYEKDRDWVRSFWDALRPHASESGGYVNFMAELDEERVRSAYGPGKYARLAGIKARWDPENVFHLNANIRPA